MDRDTEIEALIGPDATQDLRDAVAEGAYASTEEALRAAVDTLTEQRRKPDPWVKAALQEGIADVEAGRVHTVTADFWDDLRQEAAVRMRDQAT